MSHRFSTVHHYYKRPFAAEKIDQELEKCIDRKCLGFVSYMFKVVVELRKFVYLVDVSQGIKVEGSRK